MSRFNTNYIKNASSVVDLLYPRIDSVAGEKILSSYAPNKKLITTLQKTDSLYVYLYLKPFGDSILFLSAVQATLDYLKLTRKSDMPTLYSQKDMESLLQHCNIFNNAVYIDEVEQQFATVSKTKTVVMITDGDPFQFTKPSFVFNTENYLYPKFREARNGRQTREYKSRPARYYLTFEREVGMVLSSNPNYSLPTFGFSDDHKLNKKIEFNFDKFDLCVSLVTFVHSKERQKQFGVLRYLEVANKIQKSLKEKSVGFVLFAHKDEERESWHKVVSYLKKHPKLNVFIYDNYEIEEIGYILARMDLHIGNDTGISHLASISRISKDSKLTPTIITYSRHDFDKWSSGHDNVVPVYTKLAKYLTETNKSLSRDKLDMKLWGKEEFASSISKSRIARHALSFLSI